MTPTHTERLTSPAAEKLTTADLNRYSKAFVASLEKSGVPEERVNASVAAFCEELPGFINRTGYGGPHTVTQFKERAAAVQEVQMQKLDYKDPDGRNQPQKNALTTAFAAADAAITDRPQSQSAPLTLEAVTSFGDVLSSRLKQKLPEGENAANQIIYHMRRHFPEMVSREGNLPETTQQFQEQVKAAQGNVIARMQKPLPDSVSHLESSFSTALASFSRPPITVQR